MNVDQSASRGSTNPDAGGGIELPDEAGPITIGWWHNRFMTGCNGKGADCQLGHCPHESKWAKCISFTGSYEKAAPVGGPVERPGWDARNASGRTRQGRWWQSDEHGHQRAIILGKRYGYFADDVDDADLYESEALLAKFITRADAMSTRGDHWHALVWVPPHLRHLWPDRNVPGADIKGAGDGFVPVPGSVHYSGEPYQAVAGAVAIVATEEMLMAIRNQVVSDRARAAGYTGGSANGRQGDLLKELMRLPEGVSKEEARGRWMRRYDELNAVKDHDIDIDPDGLFDRQWRWRQGRRASGGAGAGQGRATGSVHCLRSSRTVCRVVKAEGGKPAAIHCEQPSTCGNDVRVYLAERDPWAIKLKVEAEARKYEKKTDWTPDDNGCPPGAWELYLEIADVRMDGRAPRESDDWVRGRDPSGSLLRWLTGMHLVIRNEEGSLDITGFPKIDKEKTTERTYPGYADAVRARMDAGGQWRAAKIEGGNWTDRDQIDAQVLKAHEALRGEAGKRGETGRITLADYCREIQPYALAHGRNAVTVSLVCRSRKRLLEAGLLHEDQPAERYIDDHEPTGVPATYAPGPETDKDRLELMGRWDTASLTFAETCERGWRAALEGLGIDPGTETRSRARLEELREAWKAARMAAFAAERDFRRWLRERPDGQRHGSRARKSRRGV